MRYMLTFGHTALQNFKIDVFLKTKSGFVGSYTGQYVREIGLFLCFMFSVFRVSICKYLNSECYTSQNPTWGGESDAYPHQGWRNPTKCECIITIALTLVAKLNCRLAGHIFHIYFFV